MRSVNNQLVSNYQNKQIRRGPPQFTYHWKNYQQLCSMTRQRSRRIRRRAHPCNPVGRFWRSTKRVHVVWCSCHGALVCWFWWWSWLVGVFLTIPYKIIFHILGWAQERPEQPDMGWAFDGLFSVPECGEFTKPFFLQSKSACGMLHTQHDFLFTTCLRKKQRLRHATLHGNSFTSN